MPAEPEEDDPVILMYTGGTTGLPERGAPRPTSGDAERLPRRPDIGLSESRRFLFQSPMFHAAVVAGVVGIPASGGTSVSVPVVRSGIRDQHHRGPDDRHDHDGAGDDVHARAARFFLASSPALPSPARLRRFAYLRDPSPGWLEMFPDVDFHQGYGMTEAASVLTFLGPDEHRSVDDLLGAAGTPVFGVQLRITDSLGNEKACGESGEVCARGGNLMRGYWGNPGRPKRPCRMGGTTRAISAISIEAASFTSRTG